MVVVIIVNSYSDSNINNNDSIKNNHNDIQPTTFDEPQPFSPKAICVAKVFRSNKLGA